MMDEKHFDRPLVHYGFMLPGADHQLGDDPLAGSYIPPHVVTDPETGAKLSMHQVSITMKAWAEANLVNDAGQAESIAEMLAQSNEFMDWLGPYDTAHKATLRERIAEFRERLSNAWLVLRGDAHIDGNDRW